MPSTARLLRLVGLSILVCGLLSVGSGYVLEETDDCVFGSSITVERHVPVEQTERAADDASARTERYENLSERERQLFDEALADLRESDGDTGSSRTYNGDAGDMDVVVHDGVRYDVTYVSTDCASPGAVPLVGGVLGAALGGIVLVVGVVVDWRRRST